MTMYGCASRTERLSVNVYDFIKFARLCSDCLGTGISISSVSSSEFSCNSGVGTICCDPLLAVEVFGQVELIGMKARRGINAP